MTTTAVVFLSGMFFVLFRYSYLIDHSFTQSQCVYSGEIIAGTCKQRFWYIHVCTATKRKLPIFYSVDIGITTATSPGFGHSCFVPELVAGSDNHSDAHADQPSV